MQALEDVSLDMQSGELLAVLGPSGCGKTTLLNIIAGFLAPTSGELYLGDEAITGPDRARGMVFQQGALFEWMSVRLAENSREAAEQLAQDYGLSLKYYMGRIGLAVFSAPSLANALDIQPLIAQDDGVRRAQHSIVSQTYQPQ